MRMGDGGTEEGVSGVEERGREQQKAQTASAARPAHASQSRRPSDAQSALFSRATRTRSEVNRIRRQCEKR